MRQIDCNPILKPQPMEIVECDPMPDPWNVVTIDCIPLEQFAGDGVRQTALSMRQAGDQRASPSESRVMRRRRSLRWPRWALSGMALSIGLLSLPLGMSTTQADIGPCFACANSILALDRGFTSTSGGMTADVHTTNYTTPS